MLYEVNSEGWSARVDGASCTGATAARAFRTLAEELEVAGRKSCRWECAEPPGGSFGQGVRWQHGSCRLFGEEHRELILQPRPRGEVPGTAHAQVSTRTAKGVPAQAANTHITIMHNKTFVITCLAAAAFMLGCNKEQTTSQQLNKLQTETKQAAQGMKDYTFAQKAEFVETMQTQLAALKGDLDQLSAKVEKSSDAVKAEAKPKLRALRDQTAQLHKQLDEVKNASESTWESVKSGFKTAYVSSKDGFNEARQWVSDKVAP